MVTSGYVHVVTCAGDVLNCLSSYETGPVLLARPCISDQSDSSTVSCDTWFLWKPDAVDASLYTHRLTMANDEGKLTDHLEF